jgi:hypothetical protein
MLGEEASSIGAYHPADVPIAESDVDCKATNSAVAHLVVGDGVVLKGHQIRSTAHWSPTDPREGDIYGQDDVSVRGQYQTAKAKELVHLAVIMRRQLGTDGQQAKEACSTRVREQPVGLHAGSASGVGTDRNIPKVVRGTSESRGCERRDYDAG